MNLSAEDSIPLRLTEGNERGPNRIPMLMKEGGRVGNVEVRVEELCAQAGDMVLMHPWVIHTSSPIRGNKPRFTLAKNINLDATSARD